MKKKTAKQKDQQTQTYKEGILPDPTSLGFQKINNRDWLPLLFLSLYLIVEFIPGSNTADVMGNQWLYLTIINLICLLWITWNKLFIFNSFFDSILSRSYILFFIIAGISIFFALNKTESFVCYARAVNTIIMYFILATIFFGRINLFKVAAQIISIILLIQAVHTLLEFSKGFGNTELNSLIMNLKGNAGNKNILSAGLIIKIPFAIYCILCFNIWSKIFNAVILGLSLLSIFILNARTSYLSAIIILILFIFFTLFFEYKKKSIINIFSKISIVLIPFIVSFFISQLLVKEAISLQEKETAYGTVTERLATISFSEEGSNARVLMWSGAVNYIKNHPLMGSGYGNWKLASIPYEKEYVDDFLVNYHAHNDFLEVTAETGLIGGLSYLAVFAITFLYISKFLFSKSSEPIKALALITLMGLAAYFTDSFFNFPMERPVMQLYFALILGVGFLLNETKKKESKSVYFKKKLATKLIVLTIFLLLLSSLYINFLTYKSLIVQAKVNKDMNQPIPQTKWEDIKYAFPAIPNINSFCFPINNIKAFYLLQDKKYNEALYYLNKESDIKANPFLGLTEYLKGKIFNELNNTDSAFIFARKAFKIKPRARINYELISGIAIKMKDSLTLTEVFREHIKYRNDAWAWNRYIEYLTNIGYEKEKLTILTDSALSKFPDNKELIQKANELKSITGEFYSSQEQETEFKKYFELALIQFSNKNFTDAAKNFLLASKLKPGQYLTYENAGLCYYSIKDYNNAIYYFDKVILLNTSSDGKVEFFKGLCLLNLNRKNEGCTYLNISVKKNYKEALEQQSFYCK